MKNPSTKADLPVVLSRYLDKEREELIAHHASMRHWQLMGQLLGEAARHPLREHPRQTMARSSPKTL